MNSPWQTVHVARGRTEPLTWTLMWKGAPANLTTLGISTVLFYLMSVDYWLPDSIDEWTQTIMDLLTLKVDGASCTIVNSSTGDISWAPATADLNAQGKYYYQFRAADSGGKLSPWPEDISKSKMIVHPSIVPVN